MRDALTILGVHISRQHCQSLLYVDQVVSASRQARISLKV